MPGMTPGEEAVMSRFDQGWTERDIASELDISVARARAIISTFDSNPKHDELRERRVRRGSQRLLWHIRKAGGHR